MNITNLKLSGELNIYAAAETQQAVQQALLEGGSALSLDLSDVSELDTAGVQQLLARTFAGHPVIVEGKP